MATAIFVFPFKNLIFGAKKHEKCILSTEADAELYALKYLFKTFGYTYLEKQTIAKVIT